MTHLDSSALATYNSLVDPHLQCYFSNERIRSHLKHAGLITRRGEIISDSEYRLKLARREHKKHVRQMLAENIVHRAIDMERARQSELRRQLDIIAKAALVNSVKESRRRVGYSSGNLASPNEMDGPSMQSSWSQSRPRSASHHHEIAMLNEELGNPPRVQSALIHNDQRRKRTSKSPARRSRYLNRPKSSSAQRSSPSQRPRSPVKPTEPPCQIKMVYYGPHTKIDYDHSLFEPVDEIMVMQQHCGGENLIVYKNNLKAGDEFEFNSRRHADYPLGLSLYVKGLIDSRISTCCEYKHRHGVRLGGERGHFAIVSVEGSKPCLKCRFEKQTQLKQSAGSDDDDEENAKPITISIPVSDQPKAKQTPVKIPVRHTSNSNENYSDDFDEPEKQKPSHSRSKSPTETSSTSTVKSDENVPTKTWQIIFYTSNIPTGSFNLPKKPSVNALLKFSFISMDGNDETEPYAIQMKDFPQCFKSARQDSFRAKLRSIGKPKQIRLNLEVTGLDNDDIKWHLDHIIVIDPETQAQYKFPCNQWIRPSEEKLLNHSTSTRKSSSSTNGSKSSNRKKPSAIIEPKPKVSSRSSSSSYESPKRFELIKKPIIPLRRPSTDNESNDQNKVHYRVIIYPSNDVDGEFNASNDSRIFLRVNNQTKSSNLHKKNSQYCPTFEPGENQSFEIDLKQNINEQPTELTIGYYNTDIAAGKWKLQKIVLINTETGEETIFPCKETLVRNDFNLRAEQTFQSQPKQSDDDQSTPRNANVAKRVASSPKSDEDIQPPKITHKRSSSSSESNEKSAVKNENDQSNSTFSRPKTRRGLDDNLNNDDQPSNKNQTNTDVWRPPSGLNKPSPVDPLVGLDDLQSQTTRSNEEKQTSNNLEVPFKDWYPKKEDDEDED